MAITINVNNLTLCHRASGGKSEATLPDFCFTPASPTTPVQFRNIAFSKDLAKGTTTIHADGGNMCANYGSEFFKSTGDELGTLGGVVSGTFIKEATWITFSFDVKYEGNGACRLTDKMFHNHGNTVNTSGLAQKKLATADLDLIDCILQMCAKDKKIVEKASKNLEVYSREPKKVDVYRFKNGRWTKRTLNSLGSAQGNKIWINRGMDCNSIKRTVYHEVRHTDQPPGMSRPEREMDAFISEEQWSIDRGMPPDNPDFRTIDTNGNTIVNQSAIKDSVENSYGYKVAAPGQPTPPQVVRASPDGKFVTLSDGTIRPVQENDAFKKVPNQDLDPKRIPPGKLKCP